MADTSEKFLNKDSQSDQDNAGCQQDVVVDRLREDILSGRSPTTHDGSITRQ